MYIDRLIAKYTGFTSLEDMLNTPAHYRPTCDVSRKEMLQIANAYDKAQSRRNDPRRAYRYGKPYQSWKQRLSYAVNLAPVRVLFNSPEIEARARLAAIRVKAEVYAENHPMPRAAFTAEQWVNRLGLSCPVR